MKGWIYVKGNICKREPYPNKFTKESSLQSFQKTLSWPLFYFYGVCSVTWVSWQLPKMNGCPFWIPVATTILTTNASGWMFQHLNILLMCYSMFYAYRRIYFNFIIQKNVCIISHSFTDGAQFMHINLSMDSKLHEKKIKNQ